MDFGNVFQSLWNLVIALIEAIGSVWDWLTDPLIEGFSPIELLGVGILVLIGAWVVKHLIPMG